MTTGSRGPRAIGRGGTGWNLNTQVSFEGGILESQEDSLVPSGFLSDCLNWVPEPTGGLRVRPKWFAGSALGVPATRRNKGIGMFSKFTDPSVVQVASANGNWANGTIPNVTWPAPTAIGNTLVMFVSFVTNAGGTSVPVGATGWTQRSTLPSSTTYAYVPNTAYTFVYELIPTVSYSGTVTPFTFGASNASGTYQIWIFELAGVSAFDKFAEASSTTQSVTVTTAATTQASEILLAIDTDQQQSNVAQTLSSASSGWSEYAEFDRNSTRYQSSAVYTKVVRATGVQSITVSSTLSTNNKHAGALITYKGWNSVASPTDRATLWLTAADNGTSFDIMKVDRDTLTTDTFTTADAAVGSSTDGLPVAFTTAFGAVWYTNPNFTSLRRYNGTASAIASGPAGRCIAAHKTRMWVGGTKLNPERVWFSEIGDASTWTGRGTGYFEFGDGDGEPVEDITPFNGGLVVGKQTTLWYLVGDNTDQFQKVQLNAGGAAPGRSILSTPYGCVIAGREQVWIFDGSVVTPIGRAIENSYGVASGAFVSLSYQDGSIYIADGTSGYIFVFDLNQGAWRKEKTGTAAGDATAVLYNYGDIQLAGPVASSSSSLLSFRSFPGGVRARDEGLPETFRATTGDLWLAGPRNPITPRYLWMQTRQRLGDTTERGIGITATYDSGDVDSLAGIDARTPGVYRDPLALSDIGRGRGSVKLAFSHDAQGGEDVTYDIEAAALDFEVQDAR